MAATALGKRQQAGWTDRMWNEAPHRLLMEQQAVVPAACAETQGWHLAGWGEEMNCLELHGRADSDHLWGYVEFGGEALLSLTLYPSDTVLLDGQVSLLEFFLIDKEGKNKIKGNKGRLGRLWGEQGPSVPKWTQTESHVMRRV